MPATRGRLVIQVEIPPRLQLLDLFIVEQPLKVVDGMRSIGVGCVHVFDLGQQVLDMLLSPACVAGLEGVIDFGDGKVERLARRVRYQVIETPVVSWPRPRCFRARRRSVAVSNSSRTNSSPGHSSA